MKSNKLLNNKTLVTLTIDILNNMIDSKLLKFIEEENNKINQITFRISKNVYIILFFNVSKEIKRYSYQIRDKNINVISQFKNLKKEEPNFLLDNKNLLIVYKNNSLYIPKESYYDIEIKR